MAYNTLLYNSATGNSLNFIFIGDGFLSTEQDKFNSAANTIMAAILAETLVWSPNQKLLNFFSVNINSPESGISHPYTCGQDCVNAGMAYVKKVNSAFGLSFDASGIHRWVLPTTAQSQAIENAIAANISFVNWNKCNFIPIMICNDINYGGSEWGIIACTTLHTEMAEIILHELGHAVSGLNDEYSGATHGEFWNTTLSVANGGTYTPDFSQLRWRSIYDSAVAFNGDSYKATNSCRMQSLGTQYCPVCAHQLVLDIGILIQDAGGTLQVPLVYPPTSTPPPPAPPPTQYPAPTSVWSPMQRATSMFIEAPTNIPNATKINFQARVKGTTAWDFTCNAKANNPVGLFSGLTAATVYEIQAQAVYAGGVSAWTASIFVQTT